MSKKELMKIINEQWEENECSMGEQAALHVACQMNGKDVDWFYDNIELLDEDQLLGEL